ncbi:MAG: Uma2 family endonuclease [Deltaproteobacteria bacterium]
MNEQASPIDHVTPGVWAAFEAVPEHLVAEIVDGELHTQPRPRAVHARGASRLGRSLAPFDDDPASGGPSGWIILNEPELRLGERPDVLVPDLAGWRRERMPVMPDVAAFELPPDWVCEVISPGTERLDRTRKMRTYRREAIAHLWFLSPELQMLEVYRLVAGSYVLLETFEGDARVRAEPFDAIELVLAALWAR